MFNRCLDKEIKVIVVGKNKGWKQEINNGAKNNRAMYNFPHAKFIEILKYKALLKDIVVIEVEESYTSKTSFIDNEELRIYQDNVFKNSNQTLEEVQFKDKIKAQHCKEKGIALIIIDGRKKIQSSKSMIKHIISLLEHYKACFIID